MMHEHNVTFIEVHTKLQAKQAYIIDSASNSSLMCY